MAKVAWNFTLHTTPWENAKLKCSEISTLQNRQIKMQLKYSVLQYLTQNYVQCWEKVLTAVSVIKVGHCLWDDVVNVAGADWSHALVAGVAPVSRQVVDRPPSTLHRVDDSLLQIRADATQALTQLCMQQHSLLTQPVHQVINWSLNTVTGFVFLCLLFSIFHKVSKWVSE